MGLVDVNGFFRNDYFGIEFCRKNPKHSIRFAKKYFREKEIIAIEIGVLEGEGASEILKNLNVKKLILIDPYLPYEDGNNVKDEKTITKIRQNAEIKMERYKDKIEWIKTTSDEALKKTKGVKADYIYVDGLHTYEQVKKDLENYWKLVNKGGIMAGDNITTPVFTKEIFKALSEFCVKNKLDAIITRTDWIIVKS